MSEEINQRRRRLFGAAAMSIAATEFVMIASQLPAGMAPCTGSFAIRGK
jgi:hypothetical protein